MASSFLQSTPLAITLALVLSWAVETRGEISAYDQLVKFGLPPGLLPPTVESYVLYDDGHFSVKLQGQCYSTVNHGLIHVKYAPTITGLIKEGRLSELKGITVKPPQTLFLWVDVNLIYVDVPYPTPGIIHFVVYFGIEEILDVEEFSALRVCTKKPTLGDAFQGFISRAYSKLFGVSSSSDFKKKPLTEAT